MPYQGYALLIAGVIGVVYVVATTVVAHTEARQYNPYNGNSRRRSNNFNSWDEPSIREEPPSSLQIRSIDSRRRERNVVNQSMQTDPVYDTDSIPFLQVISEMEDVMHNFD